MALIISNWSPSLLTDLDKYGIERCGTNKPERRQQKINELLEKHYKVIVPPMKLTDDIIIILGHSEHYINFLKNCHSSWVDNKDDQYIDCNSNGLVPLNFSRITSISNNSDYFNNVVSKLPFYKQMGYFGEDKMSPIYGNTYEVCKQSANNGFVACEYIKDHDIIYLSNTMPSHHAGPSNYAGYCFLQNTGICCEQLKKAGHKVAILDIDYHAASNGTYEMYKESNDTLTVSIHADPNYDYPNFSGFTNETGKHNMNHNIIFPKKATWVMYKKCLEQSIELINKFGPDILLLDFGFDTFELDTDASELYGCGLKIDDYYEMGKLLKTVGKKIIISQQGGYSMDHGPVIILNLLKGLIE
jgi:acetoin utilization deacetylase AcuC-like enzyme